MATLVLMELMLTTKDKLKQEEDNGEEAESDNPDW